MQGAHIDELFTDNRDERLKFNAQLAERSPMVTGKKPLEYFTRANVTWIDYWPSPAADYYSELLMFTACNYMLRYAYTYTIQFDIDEFWTPGRDTKEKLVPDFLDAHMKEEYADVGFFQVETLPPVSCPLHTALTACR